MTNDARLRELTEANLPFIRWSDESARTWLERERSGFVVSLQRDVAHDDHSETVAWLCALPIPAETTVVIGWPWDRLTIECAWGGVPNALDAIWMPSRDDAWIEARDGSWRLELDHEEVFRFFVPEPGR